MTTKIEYLNDIFDGDKKEYLGPKVLYKYRPFDKYTFEMLENKYLYLCKASELDDPTECIVTLNEEDYFDIENDTIRKKCVDYIIDFVKPYISDDGFNEVKNIIYRVMTPAFKMRNNFLLDASFELKKLAPDISNDDVAELVNSLVNIPKLIDSDEIKPQINRLLSIEYNAREEVGICSLAESCEMDDMWENYASMSSGYCVEYNMEDYEFNKSLLPVIYTNDRKTNLIMHVVEAFIGEVITSVSNGLIKADRSSFLKLFVTKDIKWEYQREWRLVDKASSRLSAPTINRIIIGRNAPKEKKSKMIEYCKENNIKYDLQ